MRILAVADIHSPRYLEQFREDLTGRQRPDLFLIAGDMILRGNVEEYPRVLDVIDDTLGTGFPLVACFGNEEYTDVRDQIREAVGRRVMLLDETATIVRRRRRRVGIVGTQGSLDRPTVWQKRNIPNVKSVFERRAERAAQLLVSVSHNADITVLLMHYSPCIETCEGEDSRAFGVLGSKKFYSVVLETQPDLVVHGHVHNSVKHHAVLGRSTVYNVAFPAVRSTTVIEV